MNVPVHLVCTEVFVWILLMNITVHVWMGLWELTVKQVIIYLIIKYTYYYFQIRACRLVGCL